MGNWILSTDGKPRGSTCFPIYVLHESGSSWIPILLWSNIPYCLFPSLLYHTCFITMKLFIICVMTISSMNLGFSSPYCAARSQVETIGDAYCAAGGLHRSSPTHAEQIAWMGLCMLETCRSHQTHDGQPIQVISNVFSFLSSTC